VFADAHPSKEAAVSNLIAVAYDDVGTAKNVLRELRELSVEHAISLDDAVIAEMREDGKVKLHQSVRPGAAGAAGGALWGGLIGLLFLAPFLGMAVGAASGGAVGAMTDVGVDDKFMKDLAQEMSPGSAAVIVLVRESTPDKVLPRISPFGGRVIHSSLTNDAEQHLQEALTPATTA
jgi:uncharacterized membrane protein